MMRKALLFLSLLTVAPAAAGADELSIPHTRFQLDNGLDVLVIEDHATPQLSVVIWYKVGSRDEQAGKTGFAHLFEHLMFKGSAHVPDGKIDLLFEESGGWTNAWTWFDQTVYQDQSSSDFLERALYLEADRLAGLTDTLDQAKLDNQRDVVRNERRQSYENQPYGMAELLILGALWPEDFGYHWSTIGSHEDLVAATTEDVKAFFNKYYLPNNATMVVAGDVDPKQVKVLVEKYFGWIPRGATPKRPSYPEPKPISKEITLTATDDVQVPKLFLTWRAPKAYAADEATLEVAADVLGGGKTSRLYERLVFKDRIAQDVSVDMTAFADGGEFTIEATAKPGVTTDKLKAAIDEEVAKLAKTGPTARELERVKNGFEAGFLGALESLMGRAERLARYTAMAGDPDYLAKDVERHRSVTDRAVKTAVGKYLKTNSRVSLVIGPEVK